MKMILKTEKVIKEYTDYNNHLNVAYYVRIFDIAADVMLDNFKMGGESAKKDKKTTFVAEMHTIYNQEVRLGEEVETHVTYIDHDKKRIHYRLSMFHKTKKPLLLLKCTQFIIKKLDWGKKLKLILLTLIMIKKEFIIDFLCFISKKNILQPQMKFYHYMWI